MKKMFRNAKFENKNIDNLGVLFLLSLMLVPYVKWAILFVGVFMVCHDLFDYWKNLFDYWKKQKKDKIEQIKK